jgi:hypothetical protein
MSILGLSAHSSNCSARRSILSSIEIKMRFSSYQGKGSKKWEKEVVVLGNFTG